MLVLVLVCVAMIVEVDLTVEVLVSITVLVDVTEQTFGVAGLEQEDMGRVAVIVV